MPRPMYLILRSVKSFTSSIFHLTVCLQPNIHTKVLTHLSIVETFAVPANMKLHAIPIFEFYDNAARYGPQFAGIPYILSK